MGNRWAFEIANQTRMDIQKTLGAMAVALRRKRNGWASDGSGGNVLSLNRASTAEGRLHKAQLLVIGNRLTASAVIGKPHYALPFSIEGTLKKDCPVAGASDHTLATLRNWADLFDNVTTVNGGRPIPEPQNAAIQLAIGALTVQGYSWDDMIAYLRLSGAVDPLEARTSHNVDVYLKDQVGFRHFVPNAELSACFDSIARPRVVSRSGARTPRGFPTLTIGPLNTGWIQNSGNVIANLRAVAMIPEGGRLLLS